jgi:hypothetical protein
VLPAQAHRLTAQGDAMPIQVFDVKLQKPVDYLSIEEVVALCELSEEDIAELMDYGALNSDVVVDEEIFFAAQRMQYLKEACQHRRDYDLDVFAAVLFMGYLQQIAELKQQVAELQAQLGQRPG